MRRIPTLEILEPRLPLTGDILDDPGILTPNTGNLTASQIADLIEALGPPSSVEAMPFPDDNNATTILVT